MTKARPFHPLCFALFPILALYARNMALVPAGDILRPSFFVLLVTGLLWTLAGLLLKSLARGAAVTSLLLLLFFGFRHLWVQVWRWDPLDTRAEFVIYWGVATLL